jgi:hypothetical protein
VSGHAGDDRRWRRALARGLSRARIIAWAWLVALAALGASAGPATAAPPGALRLDQGRFTVVHYAGDTRLATSLLADAVSRDTFPWLPRGDARIVIMIAPSGAVFREWAGRESAAWAAAVAFPAQHRVVVQGGAAPSDAGDPRQVLRHELAHVALHDFVGDAAPRWFDEGYASYAAGETRMEGFLSANLALVFRRMPTLATLDTLLESTHATEARAGYALALRAVNDLAAIDRERGLAPFLHALRERQRFDLALRRTFALTTEDFESAWRARTRWQFAFLAVAADSATVTSVLFLGLWPLYRRRRAAQQERLDAMRAREAVTEQTQRSAALDALLVRLGPETGPDVRDA